MNSFTGDSIIPRGRITLAVKMGVPPFTAHHFMDFLIVDHGFAYHSVGVTCIERTLCCHIYPQLMHEVSH